MNILLINPWIYDFAAYDLWMKPLGLLYIAQVLKNIGFDICLIDCMDRLHPGVSSTAESRGGGRLSKYGCGHYISEEVKKPDIIKFIPRKYKRYGMKKETFVNILKDIPKPQVILVSSGMTYWYQGVIEVIGVLKKVFIDVPIMLGGIYATLCSEHAKKFTCADYIFSGSNMTELVGVLSNISDIEIDNNSVPKDFAQFPVPHYERYSRLEYIALRTSVGCIFNCNYCAIKFLNNKFIQKKPETIIDEIEYFYNKLNIKNYAFYDDALLVNADTHITRILDFICRKGIECYFHTPNGLHARFIHEHLAELLYNSGFVNPRLSLETTHEKRQKTTGNKVDNENLVHAIKCLEKAGYKSEDIIVYIMLGMPEQELNEVKQSIEFLQKLKVRISLSEYSPIPFTACWSETGLTADTDPLLHNNSVYHLYRYKNWQKTQSIKDNVYMYNRTLTY